MNNTNQITTSSSYTNWNDRHTQTTPLEMAYVNEMGFTMIPLNLMLYMLDSLLGGIDSCTMGHICSSDDELLSLSSMKALLTQLNSEMEAYQNGPLNSIENTPAGEHPRHYWLRGLKGTIEL